MQAIPSDLTPTPPVPCAFKPGDRVVFTNDYGVSFDKTVVGFSPSPSFGRFVYLDLDCWWFAVKPESLRAA